MLGSSRSGFLHRWQTKCTVLVVMVLAVALAAPPVAASDGDMGQTGDALPTTDADAGALVAAAKGLGVGWTERPSGVADVVGAVPGGPSPLVPAMTGSK